METGVSKVLDKEALLESRLETAGTILASLVNLEKKYLSMIASIQSSQELIKADMSTIKSMLSSAENNSDVVYKVKDQVLQKSDEINKNLSTTETNISRVDGLIESIIKKSEAINETYVEMSRVKDDMVVKQEDLSRQLDLLNRKSDNLDKSIAFVLNKTMESDNLLRDSSSVAGRMESSTKSLEELATQLRRKMEEIDIRIDKVEKIESNNVNAADYYERAANAYKTEKSAEIDELVKDLKSASQSIKTVESNLSNYKSSIEEFIASHDIPVGEPSTSSQIRSIKTGLTNANSIIGLHSERIQMLTDHLVAFESSWIGRLLIRLLRLKPL